MYDRLNEWAKDDFRSLNGQIEYLLTACVRQRVKNGASVPSEFFNAHEEPETHFGETDPPL